MCQYFSILIKFESCSEFVSVYYTHFKFFLIYEFIKIMLFLISSFIMTLLMDALPLLESKDLLFTISEISDLKRNLDELIGK